MILVNMERVVGKPLPYDTKVTSHREYCEWVDSYLEETQQQSQLPVVLFYGGPGTPTPVIA